MNISHFNSLDTEQQRQELLACCQCRGWADAVIADSPFDSFQDLVESAEAHWAAADEAQVLEAFQGHPQIGDLAALRNKYASTASAEQGQVVEADEAVLIALGERNREYLDKFGFIFIVCATGKSAVEMLGLLEARIGNDRETELANGAIEQGKIMRLRLNKRFTEGDGS